MSVVDRLASLRAGVPLVVSGRVGRTSLPDAANRLGRVRVRRWAEAQLGWPNSRVQAARFSLRRGRFFPIARPPPGAMHAAQTSLNARCFSLYSPTSVLVRAPDGFGLSLPRRPYGRCCGLLGETLAAGRPRRHALDRAGQHGFLALALFIFPT